MVRVGEIERPKQIYQSESKARWVIAQRTSDLNGTHRIDSRGVSYFFYDPDTSRYTVPNEADTAPPTPRSSRVSVARFCGERWKRFWGAGRTLPLTSSPPIEAASCVTPTLPRVCVGEKERERERAKGTANGHGPPNGESGKGGVG